MQFLALAGAIVIAAVAVGLAMAFRGGGDNGAANGVDGPCVRQTFPPMGRQHVDSVRSGFQYNSFPPTSGPHYPPGPKAPAVWNVYDSPVDELALIHNLEHGGIVVQYGSKVPATTVDELTSFDQQDPNGIVLAPLPRLKGKIALTAWTHLAECSRFNEKAFTTFRDAFRAKGPEPFPLSALKPGT